MLRRNGKPTSCEPCRVSKVRCDHSTPVCRRCESKGITSKCYYHPAPLTRVKDGTSPVSATRSKPKRSVRPSRQPEITSARTPIDAQSRNTSSVAESGTRVSNHSNFLGTTSYLSVFRETPWWGSRVSSNRSMQDELEHWRTNHAYTCTRLVRLICAIKFYREHISWYYLRGRFTTVPAPLVLKALALVEEYVEKNAWNQESNCKDIYNRITAATSQPLEVRGDTSVEKFYSLFTGDNLRWEIIGFIFASAGGAVQRRFKDGQVLNLGNGEEMDTITFMNEMVLASKACIEICRQYEHTNDLMLWMQHAHFLLGTDVLGETSERLYSLFGYIVSNIYALGIHRDHPSADVPFFIAETRKRVVAIIHKSDKNCATLFGRPPRLPYQYCDFAPPLDLSDDQLFLDEKSLEIALNGLDDEGWNSQGQFYPATMIRMRHRLTTLGEEMLGLSLGSRTSSYHEDLLKTYQSCQHTWDKIPVRFRYYSNCWNEKDPLESLAMAIVSLEYLSSVFQIQRIRRQERPEATKDLLDTSMQLLSVIMDMIRHFHRQETYKQIPWIVLIFGIPVAGVLATEVRRHTILNQPLPSSSPRSEIIRTLGYLISWFQTTELPPSETRTVCMELLKLIGRLLDEALNYQPPPFSSSLGDTTNPQETDNMVVTTSTTIPSQLAEDVDISEYQNQIQGLMEGADPTESLWFGMGMELGIGDDTVLGLGRGLASDGLNWLDEIGLDTSMAGD